MDVTIWTIIAAIAAVIVVPFGILQAWPQLERLWRVIRPRKQPPVAPQPAAPAPTTVFLDTLPPPSLPPNYTARQSGRARLEEAVIADLVRAAYAENPQPVLLTGWPGSGKTTHAIHLASDSRIAQAFPGGVGWLNAEGRSCEDLARTLARALGREDIATLTDFDDLAAGLRSLLTDQRLLIVLDNVDKPAEAERFHARIWARTLCTSRYDLAGVQPRRLDVFTPEESVDYLRRATANSLPSQDADLLPEIAKELGHLPLALFLVTPRLRAPLAPLLQELRQRTLDVLSRPDHERPVRVAFESSYDPLPVALRAVYAALGTFQAPFTAEAARAVAAEMPGLALSELEGRSLCLYDAETKRYRLHPLLREYAREKWDGDPGPLLRAAGYYHDLFDDRQPSTETERLLRDEMPNLRWILERLYERWKAQPHEAAEVTHV